MAESYGSTPPVYDAPPPRKSNTPMIIGITVAVLLLCCCCLVIGLWFGFDPLMSALGTPTY